MKIKIIPRAKQVFVRPDGEQSRESKHGIITPDKVEQERKAIGTVLSVGSDIKDIKKGDRVIYGAYAGESLNIENEDYKLLFDEDILALIED